MRKRKTIATLVRVGENYSYVSRSFEKMDDAAVDIIRGCIEENCEETFTKEEIEKCFLPSFGKLKENYSWLGEPEDDFERQGDCIWEYFDGIESIKYNIHVSLIETEE